MFVLHQSSMGGMIALELASRIHERIVSLTLVVTSAGGIGIGALTPLKGVIFLTKVTFTKEIKDKIPLILGAMYPQDFLKAPAVEYDRPEVTNYDIMAPKLQFRMERQRQQPLMGAFSQMAAALTHSVSAKRLHEIAASVPKIAIVVGDDDNLVRTRNSYYLHKCMPEAEFVALEKTGHVPFSQHPKFCHALLLRVFAEGVEKAKSTQ